MVCDYLTSGSFCDLGGGGGGASSQHGGGDAEVKGGGDVCDSSSAGIASHWGAPANLSSKKWQQCPVACCCRQVNNGKFDAVRSQHRHEGARSAVRSFENVPCTSKTG